MSGRIVVGLDGSDQGRDALALAEWLAGDGDVELVAANVFPHESWGYTLPGSYEWEAFLREEAEQKVADAESVVSDSTEITSRTVSSSSEVHGLHELSEALDAEMIVVGSSHHGRLGQVLAGNVGERLLHGAPCPVAIAPKGFRTRSHRGPRTVMVGYDGSPEARDALAGAIEIASRLNTGLHLLTVAAAPPLIRSKGESTGGYKTLSHAIEETMKQRLDEALRDLGGELNAEGTLLRGSPAGELARAGVDAGLLVVGSRAYGPLRSVLLGAVSNRLVREAPCSVIVFPRGVAAAEASDRPAPATAP